MHIIYLKLQLEQMDSETRFMYAKLHFHKRIQSNEGKQPTVKFRLR